MLHSLHPEDYVPPQHLKTTRKCPECRHRFRCGHGVVSLTHYRVGDTKEVRQGLICFCSTSCLLQWEHPEMLGPIQ